jgi:hypothetical protein
VWLDLAYDTLATPMGGADTYLRTNVMGFAKAAAKVSGSRRRSRLRF